MARLSHLVARAYRDSIEGVLEWFEKISNAMTYRAYIFALPSPLVEFLRPTFRPDSLTTPYPTASLPGLPNELLTMILSDLPPKDLLSCAMAFAALGPVAAAFAHASPWKTATSPPISYADAILNDDDVTPNTYLTIDDFFPPPGVESAWRVWYDSPRMDCDPAPPYWGFREAITSLHELYAFPGFLTQARNRDGNTLDAWHSAYIWFSPAEYFMHYPDGGPAVPPEDEPRKWFDFSQVQMNPFLEGLFRDRMRVIKGKIEITLQPFRHGADALFDLRSVPEAMVRELRGMQISHPPVASVGIYAERLCNGGRWMRIAEVHVASGITLGDLLGVLRAKIPWLVKDRARELKAQADRIRSTDWVVDYDLDDACSEKEVYWDARPSPVFGLVLHHQNFGEDFGEGGHTCGRHFTRKAYVYTAEKEDVWGYWREWDAQVFKGELDELMGSGGSELTAMD